MTDDQSGGKSLFQKLRLYGMLTVGLLVLIVILQNTKQIETQVLFWTFTMPRAALLGATMLAGFAGGVIWAGFRRRR